MNTEQWRVTLPDGTTGTAVAWTDTGQLIILASALPDGLRMRWACWPEELATDTGKPLGYGFAAGLPIQEGDGT
jgi:hypothetical protein